MVQQLNSRIYLIDGYDMGVKERTGNTSLRKTS